MTEQKFEPLVPLSELGLEMSRDAAEAYGQVAGIVIHLDYLDRPAVSLPDAYKVAEQRRKDEAEWRDSESRRHIEHAEAVKHLGERLTAAFLAARDAELQRLQALGVASPAEARGEAENAGLIAARLIWAAAPVDVRTAVQSLQVPPVKADGTVDPDGTHMSFDLGTVIPRPVLDEYLHRAARHY